ncbi:MAG TPA: hypothetical protein VE988_13060 [Gemmataceae bacterium]|nr:hypothetical protein [Gemmataceae bacterium]
MEPLEPNDGEARRRDLESQLTPASEFSAKAEDAEKRRQYYLSLRKLAQRVETALRKYRAGVALEQAMREEGIECRPANLGSVSVTTYDAEGRITSSLWAHEVDALNPHYFPEEA